MAYRIAIDTGGTFTDLVLADERGGLVLGKSPTTYERIFVGIEGALKMAAEQAGPSVADVLRNTDLVIYGTTHATNAIIERNTARTAFLVTEGFQHVGTHRRQQVIPDPNPSSWRRWRFSTIRGSSPCWSTARTAAFPPRPIAAWRCAPTGTWCC